MPSLHWHTKWPACKLSSIRYLYFNISFCFLKCGNSNIALMLLMHLGDRISLEHTLLMPEKAWACNPCTMVELQYAAATEARELGNHCRMWAVNTLPQGRISQLYQHRVSQPDLPTYKPSQSFALTKPLNPSQPRCKARLSRDKVLPLTVPRAWSILTKNYDFRHAGSSLTRYPRSQKHQTTQEKLTYLRNFQCCFTVLSHNCQSLDLTLPFHGEVSVMPLWCYRKDGERTMNTLNNLQTRWQIETIHSCIIPIVWFTV